jgi:hypothetical protein
LAKLIHPRVKPVGVLNPADTQARGEAVQFNLRLVGCLRVSGLQNITKKKVMRPAGAMLVAVLFSVMSAPWARALPVVEWDTVNFFWYGSGFLMASESASSGLGGSVWGVVMLDPGGSWVELTANDATMGISHQWFEIGFGEPITLGTAAASNPLLLSTTGNPPQFGTVRLYLDQPFYLGLQLGGYAADGSYLEFGWVELYFDGTDVAATASATERTGAGIYAGTGVAIPEPASSALLLLGGLALLCRRRCRRRG